MYQCIQVISQYYPLSSVIRLMSYSRYFCLFTHSGVQHILCCVIVCFHHLLYPMLPVSLDCVLLFVFIIFCIQCCQFLWIVCFWLFSSSSVSNVASFSGLCVFDCFHHLPYPMLPVSLDCVFLIVFIIFCIQCCQFLWIVCFWLPKSLFSNFYL